jgi:hypothetical protein
MNKGKIVLFDQRRGWGYIFSDVHPYKKTQWGMGELIFFHVANSPDFKPALGLTVSFELGPPFKLGQAEQAVSLREITCGAQ